MELNEIKAKIAELRNTATELANECYLLRSRSASPYEINVADFINYELTRIACKLSDLEETEQADTDTDEDADTIADWWTDLELRDKCELANIPYPTSDSGRGEEYTDAEERANKWWNSRTNEQKREIYEDTLAWWDME